MIRWLPDDDVYVDTELDGANHPNRPAIDAVANDPGDEAAWAALRDDYRDQAERWSEWVDAQRNYDLPLQRGLQHVRRDLSVVVEVGAGSSSSFVVQAGWGRTTVVTDVALEMIWRNPAELRVACDVRAMPFADGSVDLICGLNAVPHAGEFQRVLAADGKVLWATSFGPRTPMYVTPEEVARMFAGWRVTAQRVAAGEWCLVERT